MSDFPAEILAATDGSEDAMLAAQAAISLAHYTGAGLHTPGAREPATSRPPP